MSSASEKAYAKAVGAKLREVRQRLGLSLTDVEQKSGGIWKAVVVGSYERADRAVTIARLAALCAFYGVPVSDVLPDEDREIAVQALAVRVVIKAAQYAANYLEPARAEELAPEFPVPAQRQYAEVTR